MPTYIVIGCLKYGNICYAQQFDLYTIGISMALIGMHYTHIYAIHIAAICYGCKH